MHFVFLRRACYFSSAALWKGSGILFFLAPMFTAPFTTSVAFSFEVIVINFGKCMLLSVIRMYTNDFFKACILLRKRMSS